MNQVLIVEKDVRGYMKILFNRPEKRNAVNYQLMDELEAVLSKAASDDEVKMLILTGAGSQAFCSGGDLSEFHDLYTEEEAFTMLSKMGKILYTLAVFPKPTLALLNGSAVGGGCEIATACDFRLAKSGVKLGFVQGTLGITTGWGGASLLLEKIPEQKALKLLLDAKIHKAEEAREFGFVDKIIEEDTNGWEEFVEDLLRHETGVLMAYKKLLVKKWKDSGIKGRMEAEIRECAKLWATDAHHAAVDRFLNKKK
ncbi:enoyl-CoA hydratase [Peribacillus butanolivorans]|uniref:Ethylmalonyl-CoA decarboxylase n=1 Tax=Peribacillus butanolivorans TaxID=421767 RepID=A0AAX0S4T4_9BACI|nr:enoyl-CoA hydratase/isomerase family protein [Peribacillus butanolivorans]AXN40431.1 enoyl-CoA hydratase/isomerase family protein [Peribacillus butanolivorans]PEJ35178.1 enoyl-CoA hydratase [Peribacillus butanolivorans]